MNWLDEGSLYSQISAFLREDLGRGDITSQAIVARNTRARGRFVAGEKMVVAGLEAAEEVFLTLDPQQQLEAFVSEGEEIEAGKVIARVVGFADVLLSGERVALNLLQRLSAVATVTSEFVKVVDGTGVAIVDSRETTPGLRMLEKYAVLLGGGSNSNFGLDDSVLVTANHAAISGNLMTAVKNAKDRLGLLHKIRAQVASEGELREAIEGGADILQLHGLNPEEVGRLVPIARDGGRSFSIECSGEITLANVRAYAETGVNVISINLLNNAARGVNISFKLQPA